MVLYRQPYACRGAEVSATAGWCLIFPSYWLLNVLLALYRPTTLERGPNREGGRAACSSRHHCCYRTLLLTIATPTLVALLLVAAASAVVGALLLWLPAQPCRRPYRYSERLAVAAAARRDGDGGGGDDARSINRGRSVSLLSCNVCLLPEGIARFNNLGNTAQRAVRIAQVLAGSSGGRASVDASTEAAARRARLSAAVPRDVDLICMQEVFDGGAAATMRRTLERRYPYVLSEVGAFRCGKLLNSGLLLASKLKILDADFFPFSHAAAEDALATKGLLAAKVQVDDVVGDLVGYVFVSHLQAHRDHSQVRQAQLDNIDDGIVQFKQNCSHPDEKVAFELLCGDFNMDHTSDEHKHSLFDDYEDSCHRSENIEIDERDGACHFAVGTELIQDRMYDEDVRTADDLLKTLLNDDRRPQHIESCCSANGGGRRRIDYIFVKRPPKDDDSVQVDIGEHATLTALATLTDHLPVYSQLTVKYRRGAAAGNSNNRYFDD